MIAAERWVPADGMRLERNAERAVRETLSSVALTAGPGSGKTEVLAQRADFLFRTGTCGYPRRVLAISFKRDAAQNLKSRVLQRCGYSFASRLDSHTFHAFAKKLIDRYRLVLTGVNALNADYEITKETRIHATHITFKDLVPLALEIVRTSAAARGALRQTYTDVFLDEFQDCTSEQYELVSAIFLDSHVRMTAVGDGNQMIMGWAGALDGVFKRFAVEFDAKSLHLFHNFRSDPRLRRMQNAMLTVMEPEAASPPDSLVGDQGLVEALLFDTDEDEAEHIARFVAEEIEAGTAPGQVAILVAMQPHLYCALIMSKLTELRIPWRNEAETQESMAEPIARLILDLLRVVFDDHQAKAYERLTRVALGGSIDIAFRDLKQGRVNRYIQAARAAVRAEAVDDTSLAYLQSLVSGFLKVVGPDTVTALSSDYEQSSRLVEVVDQAVMRFYALVDEATPPVEALKRLGDLDAVRILTIHKSKGLEFETVVLPAIEDQTFYKKSKAERFTYFVGISRAKHRLLISAVEYRRKPEGANEHWRSKRTPHREFMSYALE